MKRKMKFSITLLILVSSVLLMGGSSQATLQSNPNTNYTTAKTIGDWISEIRGMEDTNGAMGLAEERNADLTGTTSNNIDVHFVKNIEYGAMAILSASGYGNPSNDKEITTTTGNNTGVILRTNAYEWTANGTSTKAGINERYYDLYGADPKIGDALVTCAKWHSATNSDWFNTALYAVTRGMGGIFSYNGHMNYVNGQPYLLNGWGGTYSKHNSNAFARAVVVCGQGL